MTTVLVVTSVHRPDDTRIRERLIRTLAREFRVVYATRTPGPVDRDGLEWLELRGGRLRRNLAALATMTRSGWDVVVVHDPELVPAALVARAVRRDPVVFDVHEDFEALAGTRSWVPGWLRAPLAWSVRVLLRVAERFLDLTLAEQGYLELFRDPHPVFANYPDTSGYPEPAGGGDGSVVYVGDVTRQRGVPVALEACAQLGVTLKLIGPVASDMEAALGSVGGPSSPVVMGSLPNPEAVGFMAASSVGIAPLLDLPNYRHSQPTKVLEYLAAGLPVVASDLPGTRELVEGLETVFLVRPGDPAELAEAIETALAAEVSNAARDQAASIRERFRWPAEEVLRFYRSLA